jgi:hypothetical protein
MGRSDPAFLVLDADTDSGLKDPDSENGRDYLTTTRHMMPNSGNSDGFDVN